MCRPENRTPSRTRTRATVRLKADTTYEPNATVLARKKTTYVVSGFCGTWGVLVAAVMLACSGVLAQSPKYSVGRTPTDEDIRALGIMVAPDGTGLPPGAGTAVEGKAVFT